jgi:glycosyltransferase involved in cell wall biosynthesis
LTRRKINGNFNTNYINPKIMEGKPCIRCVRVTVGTVVVLVASGHSAKEILSAYPYLKEADIYLHPASYEPFGLVILEAMASGLPVICLNGKGNVGLNVEGKTGFMIDPPDAKKFADKILFLKNNPDEYSKISEYCVNFAKDYDIEIYCKKLVDIYQNAINKKLGIN